GDCVGESLVGIWELDGGPQLEEGRVIVERLADGVDELEPGTEVLVERGTRDPGPLGHVFDARGVKASFGEELAYGVLDLLACRLRAVGLAAGAVGARRHD